MFYSALRGRQRRHGSLSDHGDAVERNPGCKIDGEHWTRTQEHGQLKEKNIEANQTSPIVTRQRPSTVRREGTLRIADRDRATTLRTRLYQNQCNTKDNGSTNTARLGKDPTQH